MKNQLNQHTCYIHSARLYILKEMFSTICWVQHNRCHLQENHIYYSNAQYYTTMARDQFSMHRGIFRRVVDFAHFCRISTFSRNVVEFCTKYSIFGQVQAAIEN